MILVYRFESEDQPPLPLRLKIEINSREHFTHFRHVNVPFNVTSRWFNGEAEVTTLSTDELAATKVRALYQRKKGRDLFDLWLALDGGLLDPDNVVQCFQRYMEHGKTPVSRAEFEANLAAKATMPAFRDDVRALLAVDVRYDADTAFALVKRELLARLPGAPWQGSSSWSGRQQGRREKTPAGGGHPASSPRCNSRANGGEPPTLSSSPCRTARPTHVPRCRQGAVRGRAASYPNRSSS